MSNANRPFVDAVEAYSNFKGLFKRFCDEAAKQLNGNAYPSYVSFSAGADGASAKLQALDRTFEISLHFLIVENAPWGVLQVSLPQENKEPVRLFHLLFDNLGNVKPTSDAPKDRHTFLASTGFMKTFVDRAAREYFSHLSAVLRTGGSQEWSTR